MAHDSPSKKREKLYPPIQELHILERQVVPGQKLWMLALLLPGETTGTFIYSDKGGPSLSRTKAKAHPKTHPNFDRLQSLHDRVHRVLSNEFIANIRREDLHKRGGFYEIISGPELDTLPNDRWFLWALLHLEKHGLTERGTYIKWAMRLDSASSDSPSSSSDSMHAFSPPHLPAEAHAGPSEHESAVARVIPHVDALRVSPEMAALQAEERSRGSVEAGSRSGSHGRGPSTPRMVTPRTRLGGSGGGSARSALSSNVRTLSGNAMGKRPSPIGEGLAPVRTGRRKW